MAYYALVPAEVISVLRPHDGHFLPNLNSLALHCFPEHSIPSIPLLLSPKVTSVLLFFAYDVSKAAVAPVIKTLPTLCPNLCSIDLRVRLGDPTPTVRPIDPTITAVVSEMLLVTDRNILQRLHVNSPLTDEANQVVYKLPNLGELWVTIDGPGSLPTFALPSLTTMEVEYDGHHGWLQGFRGAALEKLTSITLRSHSPLVGEFLGAFESVAFTTSITETLSEFKHYTPHSWRPKYRSLLPFTQLKELEIRSSCRNHCSSTADDSIITDLARAMPKLEILSLGSTPCSIPAGVTVKGLAALAYHCLRLSRLCVHFQIPNLDPSVIPQVAPGGESAIPREDCALTDLDAGAIPVSEESASVVALTLLRIFPRLETIYYNIREWEKVAHAINFQRTCRSLK